MSSHIILEAASQSKSVILQQFPVILGLGPNGIVSLDDSGIGHYQCMIDREHNNGSFAVWDLGTQSGVFVNGKRVCKSVPLSGSDTLTIGENNYLVRIEE